MHILHEVQFIPPWETKVGQLQQVVRSLHQNANIYLQNRGSVIVRCYPFKSEYYMNIVYELIRNSIAAVNQFARAHFAGDISPILIQSYNGNCTPIVLSPLPFGVPIYIPNERLTDIILLRVRFNCPEVALYFLQTFNRAVYAVFDRNAMRVPFVHSDLTRPERLLRNRLQQICQQKNAGRFGSRPPMQGKNEDYSLAYYRSLCQSGERYFHNGIQLYKEYPSRQTEPVPFQSFSELQYLHVVVASLRKFAVIFNQKECSVIIQNVDLDNGSDMDLERITTLVYNVVNTQLFRDRFLGLQERNKGIPSPQINSNSYLPVRIERVERLPQPRNGLNRGGKDEINKKTSDVNADTSVNKSMRKGRPPLIRATFRSKEAAQAFCQLFKECQKLAEQKEYEATHDDGNSSCNSYSDLSESEIFIGKEENSSKKGHKNNRKHAKTSLFPNAFAHRDLTPPELALGYALRIFCREKNGSSSYGFKNENKGITINNAGGGEHQRKHFRYYVRGGRIFERSNNTPVQTKS